MAKEKEIMEKEIKEYVKLRNEEIADAFCDKHLALHYKVKNSDIRIDDFAIIAKEAQLAMGKTLEETRDMMLLLLGSIPAQLRPFYFWNLKNLMKGIETKGFMQDFFDEIIILLDSMFGAEIISVPSVEKK